MFWGLGGDGTVGANKNSIKIIGDHTDKYVQAYFQYDSKKTGGVTISHLRFGDKPIKSPYYINKADFVACHNPSYITKGFKMAQKLKAGGTFLINSQWSFEELEHHLDAEAKRYIAKNKIKLVMINAIDLAEQIGMGKRTNTILQSAFFSLANVIPEADAIKYMKDAATHSYLKKGQDVVDMNHKAIDMGATAYKVVEVPESWLNAVDDKKPVELTGRPATVKMVTEILDPVGKMDGDSLPVSALPPMRTAPSSSAPPLTRSAAWPSAFLSGTAPPACSATSAPMSARTPPSAPMPSPRTRPRPLRKPPRSSPSRPARARASTPSPWPSARWTAWVAASAPTSARPRA